MSRHKRNTGARRDRTNLYSEITDKIITELEAAACPGSSHGTAAKAPLGHSRQRRHRPHLFGHQYASCSGAQ